MKTSAKWPPICWWHFYLRPFGPWVLSLPGSVCVCVCVCLSVCQIRVVHAITHHPFKLESPTLDQKMQNILLKVPIICGLIDRNLPGQIYLHLKILFICIAFASLIFKELIRVFEMPGPNISLTVDVQKQADSRFAPSQWEMVLLYNSISHWLSTSLESVLQIPFSMDTELTVNYDIVLFYFLWLLMGLNVILLMRYHHSRWPTRWLWLFLA